MRITPQIVLESVARLKGTQAFASDSIEAVCKIIDQAVLFTFPDDMGDIDEHCAFAIDLFERGLFTLPFPVTALAFERDLGPPQGKRGGMIVLSMDAEKRISAISCSEVDDARDLKAIPVGVVLRAVVASAGPKAGTIHAETTAAVVNDKIAAAMFGPGVAGRETMRQRLLNNTVNALALVVMLMSKGVATEHIPAPERLNRSRQKKGKPLIRDRYLIRVDMGAAYTIQHPDGSTSDITGHVRGSPRMHWRRGHFRTIARGSDRERVIPVAPALIAANEFAETVRSKSYTVRPKAPEVA